ncbi:unnamed protein product [Penicillium glandicola]
MASCSHQPSDSTPSIVTPTAPQDRRPLVISGPSGAGKGSLIQKLIDAHPNKFGFEVSHTTRQSRPGEKDGISYHFVSVEIYNAIKSNGGLVEGTMYNGDFYGTKIFEKQLIPILDIEMAGVRQVKTISGFEARYVFIKPRDLNVLEQRLRGRGTESERSIQARLDQAKRELEFAETTGVFDRVIINDDLERAYVKLERFVFGLE